MAAEAAEEEEETPRILWPCEMVSWWMLKSSVSDMSSRQIVVGTTGWRRKGVSMWSCAWKGMKSDAMMRMEGAR